MTTGLHRLLNSLLVFTLALVPSAHRWQVAGAEASGAAPHAAACARTACGFEGLAANAPEEPAEAPTDHEASECVICHLYSLPLAAAEPFQLAPQAWAAPEPAPGTQAQPSRSFCRWAPAAARAPPV